MTPRDPAVIDGYLRGYAEAESAQVRRLSGTWSHAVCIPACAEGPRFIETLESIRDANGGTSALIVLVINGAMDSPPAVHAQNAIFAEWIDEVCGMDDAPISLGDYRGMTVLRIDRASADRRLPPRQGVGLARKIAADIGLSLHAEEMVASPWLLNTDADVRVPDDYLCALPDPSRHLGAATYPFTHDVEGDATQRAAMVHYESFLHYNVLGLRWAGSPYAMHTIGSVMAVHAHTYAVVRGFPRRRAGEDFYLLNKLAKIAPVLPMLGQPVRIRGRMSDRVPFGTGAALTKICARSRVDTEQVYDPRVYEAVRIWNRALTAFAVAPDPAILDAELNDPALPDGMLTRVLDEQGARSAALDAATQARPGVGLRRRLFERNDAFRTLKLIHGVRDAGVSSIPIAAALDQAPFYQASVSPTPTARLATLSAAVRSGDGTPVGLNAP